MMGAAADVCRAYRVLGGHVGSPESEATVFDMLNEDSTVPSGTIKTISGENRYGTSAKLIEQCDFEPGGNVILASPDWQLPCMAAQGLSGVLNAPILLTKFDMLADITAQELVRLKPKRVVIVGGNEVISENVSDQVHDYVDAHASIERIDYNESVELSRLLYEYGKKTAAASNAISYAKLAVIAHHDCIGDLITLSPLLIANCIPVFFIKELGIVDDETASAIMSGDFDNLLVLGVDLHVPDSFLTKCEERGISCKRLVGKNPYDANEMINNLITSGKFGDSDLHLDNLIVSSVWNPADSFSAGALAIKTQSAFLLEDPQNLDSVAHAIRYISKKHGAVKSLTFIGDQIQFGKLDKELLGKAVIKAAKESA